MNEIIFICSIPFSSRVVPTMDSSGLTNKRDYLKRLFLKFWTIYFPSLPDSVVVKVRYSIVLHLRISCAISWKMWWILFPLLYWVTLITWLTSFGLSFGTKQKLNTYREWQAPKDFVNKLNVTRWQRNRISQAQIYIDLMLVVQKCPHRGCTQVI